MQIKTIILIFYIVYSLFNNLIFDFKAYQI